MLNKKDLRGNAALFRDVAQLLTVWADDLEATLGEHSATASGGNIAEREVSRNKRSVRGTVAPIEAADKKGKKAANAAVDTAPVAASAPAAEEKAEVPAAADAPVAPAEKAAAEETVPEPVPEPEPLTYVKVRGLLSGKSASGFRTQVIALINSYGAEKLSDVDPKHYPELVAAVKGWGESPTTAGGRNLVGDEVIRNKRAPRCGVAPIEDAEPEVGHA